MFSCKMHASKNHDSFYGEERMGGNNMHVNVNVLSKSNRFDDLKYPETTYHIYFTLSQNNKTNMYTYFTQFIGM